MRATTLIKTPSAIPTRTRGAVTTRTAAKASMRGARAVTNAVPIHIGTFDASDDGSWFRSQRGGVHYPWMDTMIIRTVGCAMGCGLRRRRWRIHRYASSDDGDDADDDDGERVMSGD